MKKKLRILTLMVICLLFFSTFYPISSMAETDVDPMLLKVYLDTIINPEIDKSVFGSFDFKEFSRYPEKHAQEKCLVKGRVVQVMGTRSEGYTLRIATKGDYDEVVYVFCASDPGFGILEDDYLRIYAGFFNMYTYQTILGGSISLPGFVSYAIELVE